MAEDPTYLLRAAAIDELPRRLFSHPLNPSSQIELRTLSDAAGLRRLGIHIGRVPPGKESFCYHFHQSQEEFVYILSGRGIAEIGEEQFEVGPGDFMAFPAPSPGHHLRNPFAEDLVYLMGGERGELEVGEFPRLRKRAIFQRDTAYIIDVDAARPFFGGGESE